MLGPYSEALAVREMASSRRRVPKRSWRHLFAGRTLILASIVAVGALAAVDLELDPRELLPGEGGLQVAREFFSSALRPALTYEADQVPVGTVSLPVKAGQAVGKTVFIAVAALSLALPLGLVLGLLSSASWWRRPAAGGTVRRFADAVRVGVLHGGARALIALMRSVHALLWAVLFLAAMGLSNLAAVVALAIPSAGAFAKVFSEMIDEAPPEAARRLRGAGASRLQAFLFGRLPAALPDLCAYAFYRFECALRSSAVLGFFGYTTLGYYIAASFENLHYAEVWTYLYVLLALLVTVDWWSGAVRRRLLA